jgi:hypothetical protein
MSVTFQAGKDRDGRFSGFAGVVREYVTELVQSSHPERPACSFS